MNEFELIKKYFTRSYIRQDLILSVGDDAAVVASPAGHLVLTMDTLVAGLHFPPTTTPVDIGYKTAAVNLSDLAAMGAKPLWATLALTLPETEETWLAEFSRGLFTLLDAYQVALIGGDVTRGPLTITMQAHGQVTSGNVLRRDTARIGDLIYVSGTLGDAGYALQHHRLFDNADQRFLAARLNRPTPRVKLGMAAIALAHAAIDISDGFAQDLTHILTQSGVGAEVELGKLPLSSSLKRMVEARSAYQFALNGGDDYELCLTIPPANCGLFEKTSIDIDCPVICVGKIIAGSGLHIVDGETTQGWNLVGFQHF